jgi:hypothetical protein
MEQTKLNVDDNKMLSLEGHNSFERMSAPTSSGFGGWGLRSGPELSGTRTGPDFIGNPTATM